MSKLGCVCGHTISDTSNSLPYKARILADVHYEEFFLWIAEQAQSYIDAARKGRIGAWLLERGYTQDYVDLKLSEGAILHDILSNHFSEFSRDMYECESCGRIKIQVGASNHFRSYASEDGEASSILKVSN